MISTRETAHLYIFLLGCVLAMAGFFFSRALLSIASIVLIVNAFFQGDLKERLQLLVRQHLLIAMVTAFMIALVSGIWSEDKASWLKVCMVKLPILFFPLVFILQKGMTKKFWSILTAVWIGLVLCGSFWSMMYFIQSLGNLEMMYRISKVLPTWAGDSHIRFSMAVVVALLLWLKLEGWNLIEDLRTKWIVRFFMLWLMLFLIILSAKTGWVGLFLVVIPFYLYHVFKAGYRKLVLAMLLFALALPVIAFHTIPTFQARVNYIMYELENIGQKKSEGVYSDHNRMFSMQAGWDIIKENWVAGVGYGDLAKATNDWFDVNASHVPPSERFRPLNQWLNAGAATGIFGIISVSVVAFMPFFLKEWRWNKPALAFAVFMFLIFLYENPMDDQLGVFLFSFFLLWWNYSNKLDAESNMI